MLAYQQTESTALFFFNDTATTEIYTLSLHDALPISGRRGFERPDRAGGRRKRRDHGSRNDGARSEEHTSELQSRLHLVCRLLLEKKKDHKPTSDNETPRVNQTVASSTTTRKTHRTQY